MKAQAPRACRRRIVRLRVVDGSLDCRWVWRLIHTTEWHNFGMTRAFKTRHFQRWMRKTTLTDAVLRKAVEEMTAGLIDADLGDGVVKKRIGIDSRGKRRGVRTIVATNRAGRWFFLFGYEKNEQGNISNDDLTGFQTLATDLLTYTSEQLDQFVADGVLLEI